MNTKKFDISFKGARYIGSCRELEMKVLVVTDHASHGCRLRIGPESGPRVLWIDSGREYSPDQKAHVIQLCEYRKQDAEQAIQHWLTEHNFGTIYDDVRIDLALDADLTILTMDYRR